MGCNPRLLGLIAVVLGVGILIGGLLPSWFVIWVLGMALIALGLVVLRQ